jgi:hypothetical protein
MNTRRITGEYLLVIFVLGVVIGSLGAYLWINYDLERRMLVVDDLQAGDGTINYPVWYDVPKNAMLRVTLEVIPIQEYSFELVNKYNVTCGDTEVTVVLGQTEGLLFNIFDSDWDSYSRGTVIINSSSAILEVEYNHDYGFEIPEITHDPNCPIYITVSVLRFWI